MSKNNPIPVRLREKFVSHMKAHDFDNLNDGAWFATLENAAQDFIDRYRLKFACNNTATHQYLRLSSNKDNQPKS